MKFSGLNHTGLISILLFVILFGSVFSSCMKHEKRIKDIHMENGRYKNVVLERIQERGMLIAVTDYNSTSYFIYRGTPMGYQYELLESFAKYLGVRLEIKIVDDLEKSFRMLETGQCDLIAMGLTITKGRKERVLFCNPILETRQVLIQQKSGKKNNPQSDSIFVKSTLELAGKTIHIQKGTSYSQRLVNLSDEIGAEINIIEDPDATVEELITLVANNKINYTVADEYIALVNQKYYSQIDIKTAISFPQNIGWATSKIAVGLVDTINIWLDDFSKSKTFAYIYHKYFKNPRNLYYGQSEYHSFAGGKISDYDNLIKEYAGMINWDWRLIASLIYQESRFDPTVKSWAGAFGLMQLMPGTAKRFNVDSLSTPSEQIRAGIEFIALLDKQLKKIIPDKDERKVFILAAYNAGIAHVYDARRLAEKYNKDPNKWTNNVDFYMLGKSKPEFYMDSVVKYGYCRGSETYAFVNEILNRYEHYKNVIIQ